VRLGNRSFSHWRPQNRPVFDHHIQGERGPLLLVHVARRLRLNCLDCLTPQVVKMVECLGCGLTRTDPFFVGALDFPDHLVLQFSSCLAGRGVKDISERTWCNFTHCYIIQPRIGESGECGFSLFACEYHMTKYLRLLSGVFLYE
jgi:hypothetical protein